MQENKNSIWYASSMRPYPGNEPWYYDVKNISWAVKLENGWEAWRDEMNGFILEKDTKFISSAAFYEGIDTSKNWNAVMLLFWGVKISDELKKKCPHLNLLLKEIPGLVSVSISRLNAHAAISEHDGDTNAIMRCHIGLEIPGDLPLCGFKANGEERGWTEGKCLIFNDAYRHSAWNNSDKRRIILILDVVRPEFLKRKNLICAFILARHASYLYDKIKFIQVMPVFIKTILFAFILGCIYVLKPVYNLFR